MNGQIQTQNLFFNAVAVFVLLRFRFARTGSGQAKGNQLFYLVGWFAMAMLCRQRGVQDQGVHPQSID